MTSLQDALKRPAVIALLAAGLNVAQIAFAQQASMPASRDSGIAIPSGHLGIGRLATPEEIAGWDIDIRPDGHGLPAGKGSVKDGEALYGQRCAGCHGEFGEGVGRWPALSGGSAALTGDRPIKTIGSFWPSAATLLDYIRRAQPFGNAQSLTNDELYALAAYLLFLNDIVDDKFVLTKHTLQKIRMPNAEGFYDDDRETAERQFWNPTPCMENCKADVKITGRASALQATPAADDR
jgi:mono/diheme cytochrome c family protein